jgi:hypothetical protein
MAAVMHSLLACVEQRELTVARDLFPKGMDV